MTEEIKLYPCRFCGHAPPIKIKEARWGIEYAILCEKCFHTVSPHFMRDIDKLKAAWQARNEKHNPFIEVI